MNTGFNTGIRLNEQKTKNDTAASENGKQEDMKAQLRELTKAVNKAMDDTYVTASGNIDAMAGMLNNKSEKLIKLRSKTRQTGKKTNAEAAA